MKSITKLMVVAMLLVAALVVAPVAARDIANSGSTVYIGEKHVNMTMAFNVSYDSTTHPGFPENGSLVYYSSYASDKAATIGHIISVGDATDFKISAVNFPSTGQWYAFNGTSQKALSDPSTASGSFIVSKPSVTLDVKLKGSSVDGKTVTPASTIVFEIEHNIGVDKAAVENKNNGFLMDIEVETPDGGTLTQLDTENLKGRLLLDTVNETGYISLTGLQSGTYTAQAKWGNTSALDADKSNTVTFTIGTKALAVTASKDSVVRGNSFSVTITGESKTDYNVTVKGADPAEPTKSPMIAPSQAAFNTSVTAYETNATIKTDSGGSATIQFNTTPDTEAKTYTIEVNERFGDGKDEVKVKVEAGSVTIVPSGTGTYYIGEEITLSGTCTESKTVYLFVTGPNLGSNGVNLTHLGPVKNGVGFTEVDVEVDDTWSKKWNTADLGDKSLDAGGYTVYAVSKPLGKEDGLSNAEYATAAINLRTGFLSVDPIGAAVARGDDLKITGTAHGKPDNVYIWIFGKNYYGGDSGTLDVAKASVESDNSFEEKIETKDLAAGQYFVIVQHPMGVTAAASQAGSIKYNSPSAGKISGTGINEVKLTGLQAPAAAAALIDALESPNIPDTYVKLTFFVEEAYLFIDTIGTKEAGSKFTITGTTNLAAGGTVNVDVTSAAFQPGQKTEATAFSSTAGTAVIEKGDDANKWSFEVDAAGFKPDQYVVKVESIETSTTNSATFNMVEAGEAPATTPPAGETTTPPAGETTTPPAGETTTPTEPAPTPGFGALVALAGLGAVAFLVLRRK